MTQIMTESNYMGVFVDEGEAENKSCATCMFEREVDRHDCNACAREWQASSMTRFIGWKAK